MQTLFEKNINIQGKGFVVAAPDNATPGGSYYYHWSRDGALSMYAFMLARDFDLKQVQTNMDAYNGWVKSLQGKKDPFDLDIRDEVKYTIPDGNVYDGGWCRPQNDAPGLRALTLMAYANLLDADTIKSKGLWTGSNDLNGGSIAFDLDHAVTLSQTNNQTCDLWEEIRSDDIFWNNFTRHRALELGSKFAEKMGDDARKQKYADAANSLKSNLNAHWDSNNK
jgi:glucoamylase